MKIWKLEPNVNDYDSLFPVEGNLLNYIQSFDGRNHLKNWSPLPVKRVEPEKNLKLSDTPYSVLPVFSKKALDILYPLICEHIEALPLQFDEGEYFGINVTTVLNALNYEKSDYRTFPESKKIMVIRKYCFYPEIVADVPIFKLVDEPVRSPFVSDQFKELVEKNDLTGFKFELVWDSEVE